jgi:hypothetical protein
MFESVVTIEIKELFVVVLTEDPVVFKSLPDVFVDTFEG